jgi:hypothetical protein
MAKIPLNTPIAKIKLTAVHKVRVASAVIWLMENKRLLN